MRQRRYLVLTLLLLAGALAWGAPGGAAPQAVVVIKMMSDHTGADAWFDPVGVAVAPGTTVRWILNSHAHSTTAYHPANDRHSLRIPMGAKAWDSGIMTDPGQRFEVRLTVPGTYDYYCSPHEAFGMAGRIVVGVPGGPGSLGFDYFKGRKDGASWRAVPAAVQKTLPSVQRIVREKTVHRGQG